MKVIGSRPQFGVFGSPESISIHSQARSIRGSSSLAEWQVGAVYGEAGLAFPNGLKVLLAGACANTVPAWIHDGHAVRSLSHQLEWGYKEGKFADPLGVMGYLNNTKWTLDAGLFEFCMIAYTPLQRNRVVVMHQAREEVSHLTPFVLHSQEYNVRHPLWFYTQEMGIKFSPEQISTEATIHRLPKSVSGIGIIAGRDNLSELCQSTTVNVDWKLRLKLKPRPDTYDLSEVDADMVGMIIR